MPKNYPVYNLNNETIVILPGSRFTKNELVSRLHEINKDVDNYKDKKELASLYDLNLMDDRNKFVLINRLRKDTENFKSKLEISQRQSIFESNANTMSNNSKNKLLNISYDVKPFTQNNSIQQEITITKPNNINRKSNYQNTYISSNTSQNQENTNYRYSNYDNQLRNNNSKNYSNSRNFQENNRSNLNISYSNNNQFNNNNNSHYNQRQISYQPKEYENSINTINNDNNMNMNNKGYNNINYRQKYKEGINSDINRNDNNKFFQDNLNNPKILTNIRTQNPINIQDSTSNNNNQTNNNNYKNVNNFKNISFNPSQNPFQEDNSQKMIIEEPRQSSLSNGEDQNNQRIPPNKREYEEPTLISIIIVFITIGQIFLIYKYWDSIVEILANPSRIFNAIFEFASSIFLSPFRYFYYAIPLLLLIAIMVVIYQKYVFKNRCREIIKKIKEYLINNQNMGENNEITEDDIYERFVKNYGISIEEFRKKYINTLRKMRRNVSGLKMKGQSFNGKEIMAWFFGRS